MVLVGFFADARRDQTPPPGQSGTETLVAVTLVRMANTPSLAPSSTTHFHGSVSVYFNHQLKPRKTAALR